VRSTIDGVAIGIGLALLTVLLSGVVAQRALERQVDSARRLAETHRVLVRVESALANIEGAESAQRGYIITDAGHHREQFRLAIVAARANLGSLERLVVDEADQEMLSRLHELVERRVRHLEVTMLLHDAEGFMASQPVIAGGAGAELMDSIRAHVGVWTASQHRLLESRADQSASSAREAMLTLMGSTALSILLLTTAAVMLVRTQRRRRVAERKLHGALRRARGADRAKSLFLATVSHEIRTPLNAVLGMTDLLLNTPLSAEQEELARTVQANSESLLALVGDLLDSSKIDAGQMQLEEIRFDLREVVEGVAEILAVRAEAKDLELVLSLDPEMPRSFTGDPARLRQVVMNLVGNAIKFTDRGEVAILLEVLDRVEDQASLSLTVRDTGIGISPDDQHRIFQRFVQTGAARRRLGGTGLGLSIASALVQRMGGRIEVESTVGEGSTFRLLLDLPVAEETGQRPDPPLAGLRVLSLVRHPLRRFAVERVLDAAGAIVDSPVDLRAAATGWPEEFDVVLLDDAFAETEQLETRLRESRGGAVVRLCSLGNQGAGSHLAPPAACVYKPIRQSRLVDAIASAAGVTQPAPPLGETPALERYGGPPCRVLVVDDNPDNQRLLARYLTDEGFEVDLVGDGAPAVERADRVRYDMVLMDVEMPGMDGIEATRQIRARETARGEPPVPIAAVTAHAVAQVRERCLEAGMDDFATKPLSRAEALRLLDLWIDRRPLVLVVDDAWEMHTLLRNYLQDEPCRLLHAYDGADAIETFSRHRVATVLLDMDMPRMNGVETAAAMRILPGGEAVPIIAMTGFSAAESRAESQGAGCTGFLQKPIRRGEIRDVLRSALQPVEGPAVQRSASSARRRPATASGQAVAASRKLSRRIERLLAQEAPGEAVLLASQIAHLAAQGGLHRAGSLADELISSLERGDPESARVWNQRIMAALREADRLAAVRSSGLLDSSVEAVFDRLTQRASARLGVPITLLSVVDETRQFFKSSVGLDEPLASGRETPLSHSFCQHVVASDSPFVVEDARLHPLVRENPAIPDYGVIAYAGVPVRTREGTPLGSFCAIDKQPRKWSEQDLALLQELAEQASAEIDVRRREGEDFAASFLAQRRAESHELDRALETGDLKQAAGIGHQLKGSAAMFGFPEIGRAGAMLERAAREGDLQAIQEAREELRRQVEAASGS
jgi:signal transduction histidine kinase/CheY-like chemotaxis protein